MNKRELAKIPIINATEEVLQLHQEVGANQVVDGILDKEKELLILHVFDRGKLSKGEAKPEARVFIYHDDYITENVGSQGSKWRTLSLCNLLTGWTYDYGWKMTGIAFTERTKESIEAFYGQEVELQDVFGPIYKEQTGIREKRLLAQRKKITDKVDAQMRLVPNLPTDFVEWIENDALLKSRYMFYQYSPKVRVMGYCTHCKKEVELYKPKHGQEMQCPNCNSNVTLKSAGKSTKVEDGTIVSLIQKIADGKDAFVIRHFVIAKKYRRKYKEPTLNVSEQYRDIIDEEGKAKRFEYGLFKLQEMRWKDDEGLHRSFSSTLYPRDLEFLQNVDCMKYTGVYEMGTSNIPDLKFCIESMRTLPQQSDHTSEKLAKVGLYSLASNYSKSRWYRNEMLLGEGEKRLCKMLGVPKEYVKMLVEINAKSYELTFIQNITKAGVSCTKEQLLELRKAGYRHSVISECMTHYTLHKVLKYLKTQDIKDREVFYRDYIGACMELGYDLKNPFVAFPRHLLEKHDEYVARVGDVKLAKRGCAANVKYGNIQKIADGINQYYGFADDGFIIRPPASPMEIIKEGHTLGHCVGGDSYLAKHNAGTTAILFIRQKERADAPFFTVEMSGNEMLQIHGKGHLQPNTIELKKFLSKWKKELKKRKEKLDREAVPA